jgi:DNA modification methylase
LPEFFIKLFTKPGDTVLDPFGGSGSTGIAAKGLGRNVVLIDRKEEYCDIMREKLGNKVDVQTNQADILTNQADISPESLIQLYF